MSRFFEAYFPQIEHLLLTQSKPKSRKRYAQNSQNIKISKSKAQLLSKVKASGIQKTKIINNKTSDSGTDKKQLIINNYNMFSKNFTNWTHDVNEGKIIEPEKLPINRKSEFLTDKDYMGQDQSFIEQRQRQKSVPNPKNTYKTYTQEMQQNTYPFSKKKEKIKSKSRANHEQLRETLIKTAGNQKQSQRLEVIFESARKATKIQSHNLTQVSNRKSNAILNPIKVDEVSRTILRKSFCLQMIDDDQEWDRVIANQKKKKWNDEQNGKH